MQVVIRSVLKGTTAERIGLAPGDRILTYDGKRVSSVTQFPDMVADASGATQRRLVIRRGSEELTFEVAAGRLGVNIEMARVDSEEAKNPRAQAN
jgi:C-terminal processing protease CtpA/Prc